MTSVAVTAVAGGTTPSVRLPSRPRSVTSPASTVNPLTSRSGERTTALTSVQIGSSSSARKSRFTGKVRSSVTTTRASVVAKAGTAGAGGAGCPGPQPAGADGAASAARGP